MVSSPRGHTNNEHGDRGGLSMRTCRWSVDDLDDEIVQIECEVEKVWELAKA